MKVVFINQSAGYLTTDLIKKFHNEGFETILLTGSKIDEEIKKICYVDKIPRYNRNSSIHRVISWFLSTLSIYGKILFKYRKDKLIFYSNPPPIVFLSFLLRKVNYSYIIFDLYPDILNTNFKSNFVVSLLLDFWKFMMSHFLKNSQSIVYISEGMKLSLHNYQVNDKLNLVELWSSIEPDDIKKDDNKSIEFKKIVYSGNLGEQHPVEIIIEIAKRMQNDPVKFIISGEGSKFNYLNSEILKNNLVNVDLKKKSSLKDYIKLVQSADFMVVTNSNAASNFSIPSKLFDVMAIGRPILAICDSKSNLATIVKTYNIGFQFNIDEANSISNFLREFKDFDMFKGNIEKFNLNFHKEVQLDKLYKILK